jgi:hypothetical protein
MFRRWSMNWARHQTQILKGRMLNHLGLPQFADAAFGPLISRCKSPFCRAQTGERKTSPAETRRNVRPDEDRTQGRGEIVGKMARAGVRLRRDDAAAQFRENRPAHAQSALARQ